MVEGTHLKTLEEQVKTQETRLQGFIDSTQAALRTMEEKLESNSAKIESNIAKLKSCMIAISIQLSQMKSGDQDKGILITPRGSAERNLGLGDHGTLMEKLGHLEEMINVLSFHGRQNWNFIILMGRILESVYAKQKSSFKYIKFLSSR